MLYDTTVSNEELETSENPDEELDLELDEENQDNNEEPTAEDSEDVDALKAKLAELEHKNKQLYARLKKEPEKVVKKPVNKTQSSDITKEEIEIMFLQKDGFTTDEIQMLKTIKAGEFSQGKEISLVEASKHTLYESYLQNKKTLEDKEKAKLGASNKGGSYKQKEMTPDEHKEFAKKKAQEILSSM